MLSKATDARSVLQLSTTTQRTVHTQGFVSGRIMLHGSFCAVKLTMQCRTRGEHHRQCFNWQWHGLSDRQSLLFLWTYGSLCQYSHSLLLLPGLHTPGGKWHQKCRMQSSPVWRCLPDPSSWNHGRHLSTSGQLPRSFSND